MPFRPYHAFRNRITLANNITILQDAGNVTGEIHENFHKYNRAMIHKLRSAKYNVERLSEKLSATDISEAADPGGEFIFAVNMYIDGYFYNAGSALDILARVVLTLFGEQLRDNIYFQTAHEKISQNRPNDPILAKLRDPSWKKEFSIFRNTLTHELILASRLQINVDGTGLQTTTSIVFPLPDNPRAVPSRRTYRRNPDVLAYLSANLKRILSLANAIYGNISDRARTQGSLPIA